MVADLARRGGGAGVKGPELRAEAIVLGVVDYGDSDRVVTLLTRERGKVPAFAAGARKSKRRFAGALEPFTRLDVRLSEGKGELYFLSSCEVLAAHAGLREDLARIGHAGYAGELCRELCREREPHPELYDLLAGYLAGLCARDSRSEDLLAFELGALRHAGFSPRFSDCAMCGAEVAGGAIFDPSHGGVLCPTCAPYAQHGCVRADAPALAASRTLQASDPFTAFDLPDARALGQARALVRTFSRHVLGKRLRALDFLAQIGVEA